MSEPTEGYPALKEIFDRARLQQFASETANIWPAFDAKRFLAIATKDLADLGIMQRMRQTAVSLQATLPQDYEAALDVLRQLAPRINHGFAAITLSEFVALYGQDHFERSMQALHYFTQFGSAEFAIRHFLQRDLNRTLAVMRGWSEDENEHVRRLASEGARPRLPWSFQIKPLMADPSLAMPILENLRADPSLYVRKSVANHLNDFSKDSPDWLLTQLANWRSDNDHTQWIIRHALRSMIKRGDGRALALIGATDGADIVVDSFAVSPGTVHLGDRMTLAATLRSSSDQGQRLVVDYAIHYVKSSGSTSRKVFKLKEIDLAAGETASLSISQVIRDFTTRKHHAGAHGVELIVNGNVVASGAFDLRV